MIVEPPSGLLMGIAAHPDDIESWCAGTLARAVDKGARVRLLLVTSGESGSSDADVTRAEVAARREREARRAAGLLGIETVEFLRSPDGEVENDRALRRSLVEWIRRWKPDALFTFDPEHPLPPYLSHRDHRAVGRASLDAVYPLARDRLAFPEHATERLLPHAVHEVWLFASASADSYADITPTFERKLAARLAHESQTSNLEALRRGWRERAENRRACWPAARGDVHGAAGRLRWSGIAV